LSPPPRPRPIDHARVAWLLVLTLLGILPVVLWVLLSPILCPLLRARQRRRLLGDAGAPAEPPRPDPAAWDGRTVFLVAGEASGDRMVAPVVERMRALCPGLVVRGYAGPAAAQAGARLDRNLTEHAVVGVVAVIRSIGFWWGVCVETLARLREEPPDVFLTVDFPGLNARLARWARKRGVHTVHLVAPASWAYMPWRTLRWRLALDRLLATFPFEAVLLAGSGVPSTYVGHPLFEAPLPPPRTPETWPGDGPCRVELLPGSRRQEIRAHAPLLLEAAAHVEAGMHGAALEFVVRLAEPAHRAVFDAAAAGAQRRPARLVVVAPGDAEAGDAPASEPVPEVPLLGAIASSGTVTAELGADAVPMAIVYRLSPFAAFGAWIGLITPFFGLANLIAGREVVPERIQVSARGRRVAEDFLAAAGTPDAWTRTRAALVERVRARISVPDVAERAARAVLQR
jgi:lipid-A-disaccharide synthase